MNAKITRNKNKMRALWFARTLHDNKIRIQAGKPKMEQKDYDDAWKKIVEEFSSKTDVSIPKQ